MNKKFLSAILFGALMVGSAGTFTSCKDYDDDIDSLDQRVTAVEKLVSDLQAQIKDGAVITDVSSTATGVTVTLSNGKTFNLTNGTNGTNGAPGSVVTIGDNGNWYIDGADTGKPARGDKGDKGDQGDKGEQGDKGDQGDKGEQGDKGDQGDPGVSAPTIYYYPGTEGVEAGYWVKVTITPDGTESKSVTSETCLPKGTVTAIWDTENGYLILNNVAGTDEPVKIKLVDTLRSLAFVPQVIDKGLGMGVIDFYSILVPDKTVAGKMNFVATNTPIVTYRLNPHNADVKNVEWSFINRVVTTRVAGDNTNLLSIVSKEAGDKGGWNFVVKANDNLASLAANQEAIVALQAYNKDNMSEIVSDYAVANIKDLKDFSIAKKHLLGTGLSYYTTIQSSAIVDYKLVYNKSVKLKDLVEAWETQEVMKSLVSLGFEPTYEFTKVSKMGSDGVTDQSKFVTLTDPKNEGVVAVDKEWLTNGGRAAIGKTPLFHAIAKVNGTEIASGYFMIEIVEKESVETTPLEVTIPLGDVEYSKLPVTAQIDWAEATTKIYEELGLSKPQFETLYQNWNWQYPITGVEVAGYSFGDATATAIACINISNAVALSENTVTATLRYPSKDVYKNRDVLIHFTYKIVDNCKKPVLSDIYSPNGITTVKGKMVNNKWKLEANLRESFENYLSDYELAPNPNNHTRIYFRLEPTTPVQTGATISSGNYLTQAISLNGKLTGESKSYSVQMVADRANGSSEILSTFTVRFVTPFTVTIDPVTLQTLPAEPDTKDLSKLVTIKENGGESKVLYQNGAINTVNAGKYGLTSADFKFSYGVNAGSEFGGNLTINSTTGMITWDNEGSILHENLTAESVVKFTVESLVELTKKGQITVNKSK